METKEVLERLEAFHAAMTEWSLYLDRFGEEDKEIDEPAVHRYKELESKWLTSREEQLRMAGGTESCWKYSRYHDEGANEALEKKAFRQRHQNSRKVQNKSPTGYCDGRRSCE